MDRDTRHRYNGEPEKIGSWQHAAQFLLVQIEYRILDRAILPPLGGVSADNITAFRQQQSWLNNRRLGLD